MSHWTKVKLQVNDEETLVAALKRMGAKEVFTGSHKITQYGTTETASVWIDNAVGFRKEQDGTYSMIGDFYHSNVFNRFYGRNDKFQTELQVAYGIEDAKKKCQELGFEITFNLEGNIGDDGLIRMEAVRWC